MDIVRGGWGAIQRKEKEDVETKVKEVATKPLDASEEKLTFEEYMAVEELIFEWADSYDAKDWDRLALILAPSLHIDYSQVFPTQTPNAWPSMPPSAFTALISSPTFLGSPHITTQHLLGARKYKKTSPDTITSYQQIRAAHQRYRDAGTREAPEFVAHSYATNEFYFERVVGVGWRWKGLKPVVRWNEGEALERIFEVEKEAEA